MSKQINVICLDQLIPDNHNYRKFKKVLDFKEVMILLKRIEIGDRYKGYGIERLFKCILIQFMENLSDRELMKYLEENNAAKWFCGFDFLDNTPDYSTFSRVRSKIGDELLSKIFKMLKDQLSRRGLMLEVFTFVDASHLISKATLWEERDKAIKKKYDKLNNDVLSEVSRDKEAKIGCKGKNKFWYGYKKHVGVDMQSGLINKIEVTPANVTDSNGFERVCPDQGAVYADKGYCVGDAPKVARKKGVHLAAIKKNNMKGKNKDLDRYYSKVRSPYERVFARSSKRVRYLGVRKNRFAELMGAICFNMRRLLVIAPPGLES